MKMKFFSRRKRGTPLADPENQPLYPCCKNCGWEHLEGLIRATPAGRAYGSLESSTTAVSKKACKDGDKWPYGSHICFYCGFEGTDWAYITKERLP